MALTHMLCNLVAFVRHAIRPSVGTRVNGVPTRTDCVEAIRNLRGAA